LSFWEIEWILRFANGSKLSLLGKRLYLGGKLKERRRFQWNSLGGYLGMSNKFG
jgi:hypothetical protein